MQWQRPRAGVPWHVAVERECRACERRSEHVHASAGVHGEERALRAGAVREPRGPAQCQDALGQLRVCGERQCGLGLPYDKVTATRAGGEERGFRGAGGPRGGVKLLREHACVLGHVGADRCLELRHARPRPPHGVTSRRIDEEAARRVDGRKEAASARSDPRG